MIGYSSLYRYLNQSTNIFLLAAKDVVKPGIGYVYNWSKSTSKVEGIWIGVREKPQAVISIISLWLSEHRSWWVVIVFFYSHHSTTVWLCTFQSILMFFFFLPWSWRMCCKEWLTPYFLIIFRLSHGRLKNVWFNKLFNLEYLLQYNQS